MNIVPILAGVAMSAGGVYLILQHFKIQKKIEQARRWPHSDGIMTKLEKIGMGNKVIGTDDYRRFMLRVRYDYNVNDKPYSGTRIVFGGDIIVKSEVEEFCGRYSEGDNAKVYYDPQNPEESVLMVDRPGGKNASELYFGIGLIVVGVIVAIANAGML